MVVNWFQCSDACEQSLHLEKIQHYFIRTENSNIDNSYNSNHCTAGYRDLIIGILCSLYIRSDLMNGAVFDNLSPTEYFVVVIITPSIHFV